MVYLICRSDLQKDPLIIYRLHKGLGVGQGLRGNVLSTQGHDSSIHVNCSFSTLKENKTKVTLSESFD